MLIFYRVSFFERIGSNNTVPQVNKSHRTYLYQRRIVKLFTPFTIPKKENRDLCKIHKTNKSK